MGDGNPPKRVRLLYGYVQSGKTAAILDAIVATPTAQTCAVVVRNSQADAQQFALACKKRRPVIPVYHCSSKQVMNRDSSPMKAPKVFILLANGANLRKFLDFIGDAEFTLFIDEADKVMSSDDPNERSLRSELDRVMEAARELVLVTATPLNLAGIPQFGSSIAAEDLDLVGRRADYCDVDNLLFGSGTLMRPSDEPDDYIDEEEDSPDTTHALPDSFTTWLRGLVADSDGSAGVLAELTPKQTKLCLARMGSKLATIGMGARAVLTHPGG